MATLQLFFRSGRAKALSAPLYSPQFLLTTLTGRLTCSRFAHPNTPTACAKKQSHHPRQLLNSKSAIPTNAEFKGVFNSRILTEPYNFRAPYSSLKRQNCSYHCLPFSHCPCLTGLPTRPKYSSLSRWARIHFTLRLALLISVGIDWSHYYETAVIELTRSNE